VNRVALAADLCVYMILLAGAVQSMAPWLFAGARGLLLTYGLTFAVAGVFVLGVWALFVGLTEAAQFPAAAVEPKLLPQGGSSFSAAPLTPSPAFDELSLESMEDSREDQLLQLALKLWNRKVVPPHQVCHCHLIFALANLTRC
jgi:hypothetical protein